MPATLTDEHVLLQETAAALARRVGISSVADLPGRSGATDPTVDAEQWSLVVDAGWAALRVSEDAGGLAASGVDAALVLEELAARLAPVPLLGAAVMVPPLLAAAGAAKVSEAVANGELRLAPVLGHDLQTSDVGPDGGIAFDARGAHAGLVIEGSWPELRLRAVALGEAVAAADLTRELRVATADSVDVGDLGGLLDVDLLQRAHALALVGLSADLVGTMRTVLTLALDHARERVQFGVPVGSFQAVQHLCADAHVSVESARSAMWYGAWGVDELAPDDAVLAARVAKAWCSRAGLEVCETAIQVLGGIGMTWEHVAHLHLRRVLLDRTVLGDEQEQYERIGHLRLQDG